MNLVSVRIIVSDVAKLVGFYETVTGLSARWATEQFAELITPGCTLAVAGVATVPLFGDGVAVAAENRTAIIEFRVDDVDAEYTRLEHVIDEVVQEPKTMPWGNRSLLFRDPDGNLVNLFTPLSADAIQRFGASTTGSAVL